MAIKYEIHKEFSTWKRLYTKTLESHASGLELRTHRVMTCIPLRASILRNTFEGWRFKFRTHVDVYNNLTDLLTLLLIFTCTATELLITNTCLLPDLSMLPANVKNHKIDLIFNTSRSWCDATMMKVYIDFEYTHGNYYMSDIIEMAAIGEDSGWTFHKYINVNYKLPLNVTKLTEITDEKLERMWR